MLHTKLWWKSVNRFQRRFLKGFYHIWACQPSLSCDPDAANKFVPPTHGGSTQNLALIGAVVWEKNMFKIVNRRMPEHGYTISSPGEPSAQVS